MDETISGGFERPAGGGEDDRAADDDWLARRLRGVSSATHQDVDAPADRSGSGDADTLGPEDLAPEDVTLEDTGLAALGDPGAVIFDLDGTLVDTVGTRIAAWMETFERVGIPADRAHVAGLIGADGKRLAQEVAAVADRTLSDDRAEAIDRHAGDRYSALNTDPRPLPGASDLLTALEASELPWAIATSSRAEQVMASVDALHLPEQPRIVDGSHVAQAKPAPDLLLLAAERLSVPARRCWYVGDATWDMRAARAAAMTGIGVPSGAVGPQALEEAGASATITSLPELAAELTRRGVFRG